MAYNSLPSLVGNKYGRLTVKKLSSIIKYDKKWVCLCECGTTVVVSQGHLRSGHTISCGCLHREIITKRKKEIIYLCRRFNSMKQRCINPNNSFYKSYGGRGIKILWNSFDEFYNDMGEPPTRKHSIDRIDNNGNYCKENCRWATREQQDNNKQQSVYIAYNNKTQSMSQWAKEFNMTYSMFRKRMLSGWSMENIITKPPRYRGFYKKGGRS